MACDVSHPLRDRFLTFERESLDLGGKLYGRLSRFIAGQRPILELAARAAREPIPNILFGAVHDLVLADSDQPLADYYPSAGGTRSDAGLETEFANFCTARWQELCGIIETRFCQTNEVRRSACLLPAFSVVAAQDPGRPLSLVEIGTSAGLLLAWDRYRYRYSDGTEWGPDASPLLLTCELRGATPPLPDPGIVAARIGIDLNPLDPANTADRRWLRALVWPEHEERAQRLKLALEMACDVGVDRCAGDAQQMLPEVLASVDPNTNPCVFHSSAINQFTSRQQAELESVLIEVSKTRPLTGISANGHEIVITRYAGEKRASQVVAHYDSHGRWLDWSP